MFPALLIMPTLLLFGPATAAEPAQSYHIDVSVHDDDCDVYCEDLVRTRAEAEAALAKPSGLLWDGTYFIMGVAPSTTLHASGFHPGLRYDAELGMVWQQERTTLSVGLEGRIMQYFGRKHPGGGADVVFTTGRGPFYVRTGLGVAAGVPRADLLDQFRPVVGGVVGIGLQGGRDEFLGRVGVDYDLRFDDHYGMSHTVLLVARFAWGI